MIRTERKVQGLRREVSDDVGRVATPERDKALILVRPDEAVTDPLVRASQTTLLDLEKTGHEAIANDVD